MPDSILRNKAYAFAVRTVLLAMQLVEQRREFVLSRQILRSGTSIGANVEEASQAQSRRDFTHKLSIALKEATETNYWLRLLRDTKLLDEPSAQSLLEDCKELERMLTASIRTLKRSGS